MNSTTQEATGRPRRHTATCAQKRAVAGSWAGPGDTAPLAEAASHSRLAAGSHRHGKGQVLVGEVRGAVQRVNAPTGARRERKLRSGTGKTHTKQSPRFSQAHARRPHQRYSLEVLPNTPPSSPRIAWSGNAAMITFRTASSLALSVLREARWQPHGGRIHGRGWRQALRRDHTC